MKRIFAILFIVILLLLMILGCKSKNEATSNSSVKTISAENKPQKTTKEIIEKTSYFSIEYDNSNYMFEYFIYDNNGDVIETDIIDKQPNISLVKNDIVCKYVQWGNSTLARGTDFFDTNTGKKSAHYSGIVDSYNFYVANSTSDSVVISDMFSGRVLQVIDNFDKELYSGIEPISDLKFIEEGTKIEITYLSKNDDRITEVFVVDENQQFQKDYELVMAMRNKITFIDENENETYFRDFDLDLAEPFILEPEKSVIFDIDNDDENELIVGIKNKDDFIILDHDDGKIYGHKMWLRGFNMLNTNGEFMQSGGAAINNIARIVFDKTQTNIIKIAEKDDIDGVYKKYGETVSKELVDEYFNKFYESEQCEWIYE